MEENFSNLRRVVKNLIFECVDKVNGRKIETLLYNRTKTDISLYKIYAYQIVYNLSINSNVTGVIEDIKNDKLGFKHVDFEKEIMFKKEHDEYIERPFEIVKGLMKCPKCKSDKTLSYSKNDRSGDEAISVYTTCFNCKFNWRENN